MQDRHLYVCICSNCIYIHDNVYNKYFKMFTIDNHTYEISIRLYSIIDSQLRAEPAITAGFSGRRGAVSQVAPAGGMRRGEPGRGRAQPG